MPYDLDFRRKEPGMDGDPTRASSTKLARVVRATTAGAQPGGSAHREAHRRTNWLRDVILGGQDGLVNILGIILGVVAAGGSRTVLLATGFAAAITESISMGAVGYTSTASERDYYQAEREPRGRRDRPDAGSGAPGDSRHLRHSGVGSLAALPEPCSELPLRVRIRWAAVTDPRRYHRRWAAPHPLAGVNLIRL
jgi:hypothetical protein